MSITWAVRKPYEDYPLLSFLLVFAEHMFVFIGPGISKYPDTQSDGIRTLDHQLEGQHGAWSRMGDTNVDSLGDLT